MRKWIALFSHTGSEISKISRAIGKTPTAIITTKRKGSSDICVDLPQNITHTVDKPTAQDYREFLDKDALITMHGWMRIVPPEICDEYEILNLHPGLITKYPELKGKDPQKRVFEMLNLPDRVGCVIHKAVGEVDEGEVLMERSTINTYPTPNVLIKSLHEMASDMWIEYLNTVLYFHESRG